VQRSRVKIKLTLPADLVDHLDALAGRYGASRSSVVAFLLEGAVGPQLRAPVQGPSLGVRAGPQGPTGPQLGAPAWGPSLGPHTPHTPLGGKGESSGSTPGQEQVPQAPGSTGRADPGQELGLFGSGEPAGAIGTGDPAPSAPEGTQSSTEAIRRSVQVPSPGTVASTFEAWWSGVPRRIGKGAARPAFVAALVKLGWSKRDHPSFAAAVDKLEAARDRWAKQVEGKEAQYIPHPRTWLAQERWEDEEVEEAKVVWDESQIRQTAEWREAQRIAREKALRERSRESS